MTDEWRAWCRSGGLHVEGDQVTVQLSDGRQHRVLLTTGADAFEMSAVIIPQSVAKSIQNLAPRVWRLNRNTSLVAFRIDRYGRLVGEAWAPLTGLTGDEFRLTLRTLAFECDRLEYILTGDDRA